MFGLKFLTRLIPFGSNDNDQFGGTALGGAGAVFDAIAERTDDGFEFQIFFGEPQLIDRGNVTEDLYVVIPTSTENGPNPANLEYDLPDGIEDVAAELYDLLDLFGIETVADVGRLNGKSVPGTKVSGTVVPDFGAIESTDEESE